MELGSHDFDEDSRAEFRDPLLIGKKIAEDGFALAEFPAPPELAAARLEVVNSFDRLPPDPYLQAHFGRRHRAYSQLRWEPESPSKLELLKSAPYTQPQNPLYTGARDFAEIESAILHNPFMRALLQFGLQSLPSDHRQVPLHLGVHFLDVDYQPSPEGPHIDSPNQQSILMLYLLAEDNIETQSSCHSGYRPRTYLYDQSIGGSPKLMDFMRLEAEDCLFIVEGPGHAIAHHTDWFSSADRQRPARRQTIIIDFIKYQKAS